MKSTNIFNEVNLHQESLSSNDPIVLKDIIQHTEEHLRHGIKLSWGRQLQLDSHDPLGDRITLYNPEGKIELQIVLSEKGPILQFQTADLHIHSIGRIQLECEDFQIHAHHEIKQISEGNFHQQVAGNTSVEVKGDFQTEARMCSLTATRGNINLNANDDIKMKSERILLNC